MTFKKSSRSQVESFRALAILSELAERKAKGEDIISLSPGQPCFGAPDAALLKAQQHITEFPLQGYTAAIGRLDLRQRIAKYYKDKYNLTIPHERIAVTTASSGGFMLSMMAAFDNDDTIAIITPAYPAYKNIIKACGLKMVEIEASEETNYQPTAELLEKSGKKFDGIIINSPSNPTGSMIDAAELKKICAWCEENGVRIISDEAYHGITYETEATTAAAFSEHAIVLNTFSKYFALTGWRLGWAILPEDMTDNFKSLAENLTVSPPTLSQEVALHTMDHMDVLDGYVAHYKKNRDILKEELPKIGFNHLSNAQGAFYFYADIRDFTNDSESFCRRMIDEARVAMTPGPDFDPHHGNTTLRISYAGSQDDMYNACTRLKEWL